MSSRGAPPAVGQPSILSFFRPNNNSAPAQPPRQHQPTPPPPPPPAPLQSPSPGVVAAAAASSPASTPPASTPTPHPSASIVPIAADHIPPLRRINALLLCVNYPDSFYQRILDPAASGLFSRAILWSEADDDDPSSVEPPKVIGSIVARVEPSPFTKRRSALYIQSLTLLSPFRSLGLAKAALDAVLDHARHLRTAVDIADVYAHVWTENEDGLRWYGARGFERVGSRPEQGYYHKLRPDTAWIVRRSLDGPDTSAAMARTTVGATPAVIAPSVTAAVVNLPLKAPPAPARTISGGVTSAALCFQDKRPETDWNDLPADVAAGLLTPGSGQGSEASSRSSSTARGPKKKRDRAYPAAAFRS